MATTFTDLDLAIRKHPGTGDVVKKYDVDAVKQALRHLFFFQQYDMPFDPNFGLGINHLLFELNDPISSALIKRKIMEQVFQYEPRCFIDDIIINAVSDNNNMTIDFNFHVVGNPIAQTLSLDLERVR